MNRPNPRLAPLLMLGSIATTDLTYRIAQVAVPLVVLAGTGSPAAMGAVSGAAGVPVVLSPRWARRLRHRVRSGRAVAVCYLGEATALTVVAAGASSGTLTLSLLLGAGLLLGSAEAISGPGRDALIADLGDLRSEAHALRYLTVRELFRRVAMVVGPLVGGLAVGAGHARLLLWVEVVSVLVAALMTAPVRAVATRAEVDSVPAPGVWETVRREPPILLGWVVRGTGCLLWFAFTLGLALLGVQQGRPGLLVGVAMTGYGVGSVIATLGVLPVIRRVRPLGAIGVAWTVCGLCWVTMALVPTLAVVSLAAFTAGVAVVVGNTAVTAQITSLDRPADRRTLLAGESVVVNAAGALGLLAGGPALALLGARPVLALAGALVVAVALAVPRAAGSRSRSASRSTSRSVGSASCPSCPSPTTSARS